MIRALLLLAEVLRVRGRPAETVARLDEALLAARQHGLTGYEAIAQADRALCLESIGQAIAAREAASAALAFFSSRSVHHPAAAHLRHLAA